MSRLSHDKAHFVQGIVYHLAHASKEVVLGIKLRILQN